MYERRSRGVLALTMCRCDSCSAEAPLFQLRMYSFMGGGLFCAIVGNILLVVSTATDYWMQYRLSGSYAHQGLWRYCMSNKCYMQTDSIGTTSAWVMGWVTLDGCGGKKGD